MSHTIAYNPEWGHIDLIFSGDIFLSELKQVMAESLQVSRKHDCYLYLSDYRDAVLKLSTYEIYEIPKLLDTMASVTGLSPTRLRRALIVAKDLADYVFFETVTANNGQVNKVFQDAGEARKWLHRN